MSRYKRVHVGTSYVFEPVLIDRTMPPYNVQPGDVVTVVNLHGCPPAGTMGHCHVMKGEEFGGLVCVNSLQPVKGRS
jgi:hypothetical protein